MTGFGALKRKRGNLINICTAEKATDVHWTDIDFERNTHCLPVYLCRCSIFPNGVNGRWEKQFADLRRSSNVQGKANLVFLSNLFTRLWKTKQTYCVVMLLSWFVLIIWQRALQQILFLQIIHFKYGLNDDNDNDDDDDNEPRPRPRHGSDL